MYEDINERLEAATSKAENASGIMHDVANGAEGEFVTTESGQVPTVPEFLKQLDNEINTGVDNILADVTQAKNDTEGFRDETEQFLIQTGNLAQEVSDNKDIIDQNVITTTEQAQLAEDAKEVAVSVGNYQGDWTGSGIKGETYSYASSIWLCLENTTSPPSELDVNWQQIGSPDFLWEDVEYTNVSGQSVFNTPTGYLAFEGLTKVKYNGAELSIQSFSITDNGETITLTDPVDSVDDIVTVEVWNKVGVTSMAIIEDAVNTTKTDANNAESAATAAQATINYQGEWAGNGVAGESYLYNGEIWLCLVSTVNTPSKGDVNWREPVSAESITTAQNDIVGGSIFKGSNGEYVQNGDVVPSGTTHLRVLIDGKPTIVAMSPVASGVVSLLTEVTATIETTNVNLNQFSDTDSSYQIAFRDYDGNSAIDNMINGILPDRRVIHAVGNIYTANGIDYACRTSTTPAPSILSFWPLNGEFSHVRYSFTLDKNQFDNADTFDGGSSIVLAYQPKGSPNANELTGTQNYRYLIGGYDNKIESITTEEINGRACGHIATHHSNIRGGSNHSVCVGGSYNDMDDAWYSVICGTKNKQLPRTSIGYSAYNFIAGTLNQVQGNSNAVFGSTNIFADEVNGSFAAGSVNNINATFSAAFGTQNTVNGRDSFVAGIGNTSGEKCAAFGQGNNIGSALGSLVSGTTNTNTADYARTMGRGAYINSSHDHSDVQAHHIGADRSYTMRIPLKADTSTGAGFTNFVSILDSAGIISADTNSMLSFEVTINASTASMGNVSAFKIEGVARKVGSGVVEILSESITEIYNTDTGQMQVKMIVGATANLQVSASQGAVVDDVKWTASFLVLVRQV